MFFKNLSKVMQTMQENSTRARKHKILSLIGNMNITF